MVAILGSLVETKTDFLEERPIMGTGAMLTLFNERQYSSDQQIHSL